ncbi:sugar ABC transporter substrate-binding protein [Prauserella salsuginis]|nr:extracellular solute-binding protein [Prauserella salsuginis]
MLSWGSELVDSGVAVVSHFAGIADLLGAIVGVLSGAASAVLYMLARRNKARVMAIHVGWQIAHDAGETGAVVYNGSNVPLQQLVVTVVCGARRRTARREIAVLRPQDTHLWPSGDVHDALVSDEHETDQHKVQVVFRSGRECWLRDERSAERIRSLVLWTERTMAEPLKRYFRRDGHFRKNYSVRIEVESFDRTETLETAFGQVASTGHPPAGYRIPDVVAGPHDWLGRAVAEDWVEQPPPTVEDRAGMSSVAVDALSHGDPMYAVPYAMDSVALIRNNALTGTGPMPSTFAEAVADGQNALRAHGIHDGAAVALQVGAPDGDPYHVWPLLSSVGASFFGLGHEPGGQHGTCWRDDFVNAFERLATLGRAHSGVLDPELDHRGSLRLFLGGRAPYLICSAVALHEIRRRRLNVTAAQVPRLGTLRPITLVSVHGLYLNHRSRNPPAARDLLTTYQASPTAGEDLNRIRRIVPAHDDAMDSLRRDDPLLRTYIDQCRTGMLMPSGPGMRTAWRLLGRAEYQVLAGHGDPRAVAEATADEGHALLSGA